MDSPISGTSVRNDYFLTTPLNDVSIMITEVHELTLPQTAINNVSGIALVLPWVGWFIFSRVWHNVPHTFRNYLDG